jgi:hypothetical protein
MRKSDILEIDEEHLDDSFVKMEKEKKRKKHLEEYENKNKKIKEESILNSKI